MNAAMKKLRTLFALSLVVTTIVVVFSTSSCKDEFLDVETVSLFSKENIFTNVDYTRQAILGIYQLMTRDEGYSKRLSMYYGVDTDIAMCSGSLDNGRRGIARYAATSGNTEIERPWQNLYFGIERANICVENIPKSALYTGGTEQQVTEMRRMHGEALTLRALHYYELVRNWGDVPFKTTPSRSGEDFNLPKTDRDTIYKQIIDDLLLAETLVPWRSEVPSDERITRGAVKGLLARIALARGGYSLRSKTNLMERRPDYLEYYQLARDQCLEIMQSGQHTLNPDFVRVFKNHCELKLDTEYGESMWEIGMGTYESGEVAYYIGTKQGDFSKYGKADGGVLALPTFYLSYSEFDVRRDHTIGMYRIDNDNTKTLEKLGELRLGKWRREWMSPLLPGTDKFTGINWIMLRYADILLMFAEAENELNNGPTAAAIEAFRQVRERAFRGNIDKMPPVPTTYQEFFDEIILERAWELAGECLRKFDLIRWNLLNEKLMEMKAEMWKLFDNEPPYENIPRRLVWRKDGENLVILNLYTPMDSAQIADRDTIMWPYVDNWVDNVTEEYIHSIAEFFIPNRKELLPIHQNVIDANTRLSNDYGY